MAGITSSRSIALNTGGGTVNTNGFSSAFSGLISGNGGLTKTGAGTLSLSGVNGGGGINVNQGTLEVVQSPLGSPLGTGPVTLNGGVLKLTGHATVPGGQQTLAATGWNQDMIWGVGESSPAAGTTFSPYGYVYYEQDPSRNGGSGGLPTSLGSNRTFTSGYNSNVQFQFQPYDADNAAVLPGGSSPSVTLSLTNPAMFASLQFLGLTSNNASVTYTLTFADGTTTQGTFVQNNWTQPNAINSNLVNTNGSYYNNTAGLSEYDVTIPAGDQSKGLESITFSPNDSGTS